MDGDRKYRHSGYQDGSAAATGKLDTARIPPPRHPMDLTAPRLPRLVRNVTASRCYDCANPLPDGFDFTQPCPKCGVELHCCKQCAHFDSSAHFQCAKPIAERIAGKGQRNECALFAPGVTVARDSSPLPVRPKASAAAAPQAPPVSRHVNNARTAFENLFKK